MSSRSLAIKCLLQVVVNKKSLDDVLQSNNLEALSARDQGFVRELCFGTLRFFERLEGISNLLLHRPLPNKNTDVLLALMLGLYQIIYLQTPKHAAISESVNSIKKQKKWAAGLINKTLRVFCEDSEKFLLQVDKTETTKVSHPKWLVKLIQQDWPDYCDHIFSANNHKAPMFLRINPLLTSIEKYLGELTTAEIKAKALPELPYAIQLEQAQAISKLPHFEQGHCYVQDKSGQYVTPLLQLAEKQTVLDACSAPGSKTSDLLASHPNLSQLIALDKDPKRLEKVKQNLERLDLPQENTLLIAADALNVKDWWDGNQFDRILIDAPCSATGVIRRHPDIKLLRLAKDISQLAKLQQDLLTSLWPLLKPGGLLLYTTCSVLKQENEINVETFLKQHQDAQPLPVDIPNSHPQKVGVQLLPEIDGGDGFYYALLKKSA